MRILIVEDHLGIQIALTLLLQLEGFHAEAFGSGEAALERLEESSFDAVLLDLATDGMSATEFVQRFRARSRMKDGVPPPLLAVMSGNENIDSQARELGADFVVRKPFEHTELLAQLSSFAAARGLPGRLDTSGASAG